MNELFEPVGGRSRFSPGARKESSFEGKTKYYENIPHLHDSLSAIVTKRESYCSIHVPNSLIWISVIFDALLVVAIE